MTVFSHPLTLYSPDGHAWETVDAVVDTGSTFTWVPEEALHRLGIVPELEDDFVLANGSVERLPIAEVRAQLNGERRWVLCVFAPGGAEALMGSHTLETFRLAVDPVNRRLVPARNYALATSKGSGDTGR